AQSWWFLVFRPFFSVDPLATARWFWVVSRFRPFFLCMWRALVVQWIVSPPVTRETGVQFPDGETFIFLLAWVESKKGQEESQLHWRGIEPGPPAWQARILPLNHQCSPHTEKNGKKTRNPQMATFEPPHLSTNVFFATHCSALESPLLGDSVGVGMGLLSCTGRELFTSKEWLYVAVNEQLLFWILHAP